MSQTAAFWKRKAAPGRVTQHDDLASKIAAARSHAMGYGLLASSSNQADRSSMASLPADQEPTTATTATTTAGLYGDRSCGESQVLLRRTRLFTTPSTTRVSKRSDVSDNRSRFTHFTTRSSAKNDSASQVAAVHVICAISENLAGETCVVSMDAGRPTTLQVTKQGNGHSYSETMAYLEILKPNEILFNEGRRTSQLARKILELYQLQDDAPNVHLPYQVARPRNSNNNSNKTNKRSSFTNRSFAANASGPGSSRAGRMEAPVQDNEQTIVKFVSRALFDQTRGAALLQSIAREDTYDPRVVEEYITLSAAHAVIVYFQQTLGVMLANKSVCLNINADGISRMIIDRATLWQLELLANSKTGKARNSLVGTIDFTKTTVGSRLLRTNLMSPPTNVDTTNSRLELVDTFLGSQDFFFDVYEHLSQLPDIDTMLSNIALIPKRLEVNGDEPTDSYVRLASRGISALISIKTVLSSLPAITRTLHTHLSQLEAAQQKRSAVEDETVATGRASILIGLGGSDQSTAAPGRNLRQNYLLRAITIILSQPTLAEILAMVNDIFTETTTYTKNQNSRQHQECFALKEDGEGFLGILRKAYLSNVDDIYKKADEYAETYGMPVTVRYSSARGYFLSIPVSFSSNIPDEFLCPSKNNRSITFTTQTVTECNTRARECVRDILVMTHDRIQSVMSSIRERYDALAGLSDAIALLDMCHSFADNVTLSSEPWCRPFVSDRNPLHTSTGTSSGGASVLAESNVALLIRNGRFAISTPDSIAADLGDGSNKCVGNDTYATFRKPFTVISGINGSGKTTYLKQIAMIVVLAHCGSYVPAEQAVIPIRDRLFTRIGNADDQEHSISTFMMEMKETAFICNNATPRSLILLDELGRATSNEEGMSLAWSVSEYLLKKRCMTFFVTHYPQLVRLADTYPCVQNVHLEASVERGRANSIKYTHRVKSGACSVTTDYGVELAAVCGWPRHILCQAQAIESRVQELIPKNSFCESELDQEAQTKLLAHNNILELRRAMKELASQEFDEDTCRRAMIELQNRLAPRDDTDLLEQMRRLLLRGTNEPSSDRFAAPSIDHVEHDAGDESIHTFDIDDGLQDNSMASHNHNLHNHHSSSSSSSSSNSSEDSSSSSSSESSTSSLSEESNL